jgi:hypothetical protein
MIFMRRMVQELKIVAGQDAGTGFLAICPAIYKKMLIL